MEKSSVQAQSDLKIFIKGSLFLRINNPNLRCSPGNQLRIVIHNCNCKEYKAEEQEIEFILLGSFNDKCSKLGYPMDFRIQSDSQGNVYNSVDDPDEGLQVEHSSSEVQQEGLKNDPER